ncbi:MAG: histidine phosphatase family protein [Actinobacteria bacterium]|nr:histidine phosphatase family protein [Actinomycetota bacterium]
MTTPPPAITRVLVLRHGQSTWNAERRWQGWSDPPLSALGEKQSSDAARNLRDFEFAAACSSDLQRARRTAHVLAGKLGLGEVVVDAGLRERNVGAFTGKTAEEIRARWPECFDPATGRLLSVPEGEDDEMLFQRAAPALSALARSYPGEELLVVSHGGVIRTLERHLGVDAGPTTPNLSGRWFEVDGDGGLRAGEPVLALDPPLVTTTTTE